MHRSAVVLGALGGLLAPPLALWACSRALPGPAVCSQRTPCSQGQPCVIGRCRPAASAPVPLTARRLVYPPEDIALWDGQALHDATRLPDAIVLGRRDRHERLLLRFALPRRPPRGRLQRALLRLDPLPHCPVRAGRMAVELATILTPWRSTALSPGRLPRLDLPWRLADHSATPSAVWHLDVTALVRRWRREGNHDHGLALLTAGNSDTGACFSSGVRWGRGPRLVLYFVDPPRRDGGAEGGADAAADGSADGGERDAPGGRDE